MTNFHHQKRTGGAKKPKQRPRASLGIDGDPERLVIHRELEYLKAAAGNSVSKKVERREKLWKAEHWKSRTEDHTTKVKAVTRAGWEMYFAKCSCGWKGEEFSSEDEADVDARWHSDIDSRTT